MSTVAFDLRHPDLVAHEIAAANQRLAREREVPASIRVLIEDLADALEESDPDELGVRWRSNAGPIVRRFGPNGD